MRDVTESIAKTLGRCGVGARLVSVAHICLQSRTRWATNARYGSHRAKSSCSRAAASGEDTHHYVPPGCWCHDLPERANDRGNVHKTLFPTQNKADHIFQLLFLPSQNQRAETLYEEAQEAMSQDDFTKARRKLRQAHQADPQVSHNRPSVARQLMTLSA